MNDNDRPGGTDKAWVDPDRRRAGLVDDATSYSGQAWSRDKEEALGRALPSGTVKRPEGDAEAPPSDAADQERPAG